MIETIAIVGAVTFTALIIIVGLVWFGGRKYERTEQEISALKEKAKIEKKAKKEFQKLDKELGSVRDAGKRRMRELLKASKGSNADKPLS